MLTSFDHSRDKELFAAKQDSEKAREGKGGQEYLFTDMAMIAFAVAKSIRGAGAPLSLAKKAGRFLSQITPEHLAAAGPHPEIAEVAVNQDATQRTPAVR